MENGRKHEFITGQSCLSNLLFFFKQIIGFWYSKYGEEFLPDFQWNFDKLLSGKIEDENSKEKQGW